MVRLLVVARYAHDPRNLRFAKGDKIEVDEATAQFLMADAPGCFEVAPVEVAKAATPKANKMVESAPANK